MSTLIPTIWYDDRSETSVVSETGNVLLWAAVAFLLTLANRFAGYVIPIPAAGTLLSHLFALLYLALLLLALLQTARYAARLPVSTAMLAIVGVLLAFPMGVVLLLQQNRIPPTPFLHLTANNLFLPIAAALVGAAIGRIIRHPNTLLAAAGFSLFFDIVVVTMGTVAQLMRTGNSAIIAAVSVGAGSTPVPGAPLSKVQLPDPISGVTIGPADVLFLALFQSAVHRMDLSRRATFAWMFALLMLALAIVEFFYLPIPALVPMGIAVLVANLRHGAFTPREKRDLIIGGVFAVFCASLIIGGARFLIKPSQAVKPEFRIEPISAVGPIIVAEVTKGSVAEKAGVRPGDALYGFNGKDPMRLTYAELEEAWEKARRDGIRLKLKHMNKGPMLDINLRYDGTPPGGGSDGAGNEERKPER
ncbi:MAG: PDZ domain-containing protein [Capsulimonadales bacterium]|nr:PDZ domain-containing protein [Capsulimonadales bacterium]